MDRFAHVSIFAYMQIFAHVCKSKKMDRFAHVSIFAYMQIFAHVCKSVHVNALLDAIINGEMRYKYFKYLT